jgi:glycogen synthase
VIALLLTSLQHEFFSAGTPVIAFATGGLKDSVVQVHVTAYRLLMYCGLTILFSTTKPTAKATAAFSRCMTLLGLNGAWTRPFNFMKTKMRTPLCDAMHGILSLTLRRFVQV